MVYLKPLYCRLDRLAQRQSSPFPTEAKQEHVKILIFKMSCIFYKKKIKAEKAWVYIIHPHLCKPQKQWWSFKNTAY